MVGNKQLCADFSSTNYFSYNLFSWMLHYSRRFRWLFLFFHFSYLEIETRFLLSPVSQYFSIEFFISCIFFVAYALYLSFSVSHILIFTIILMSVIRRVVHVCFLCALFSITFIQPIQNEYVSHDTANKMSIKIHVTRKRTGKSTH